MKIWKFAAVLLSAGILDLSSTFIGLSIGLIESNPRFFQMPFMATILLFIWGIVCQKIQGIPGKVKKGISVWLIALAFYPAVWNFILILSVVL